MKNFLFQNQWDWKSSGIALSFVFFLAIVLIKPIGVSTQFVILDGLIWDIFSDDIVVVNENATKGYSSPNAYFNKGGGKYAKSIAKPINYSFIFVLAMIAGGYLAVKMQTKSGEKNNLISPKVWSNKYGNSSIRRYIAVFIGGALVLFGARLAGGCTSGHMMSGMMQTSLSGYLFAAAAFALAVPVAIIMYKEDK